MDEIDRLELERRLDLNGDNGIGDLALNEVIALIVSVMAVVLLALVWRLG